MYIQYINTYVISKSRTKMKFFETKTKHTKAENKSSDKNVGKRIN